MKQTWTVQSVKELKAMLKEWNKIFEKHDDNLPINVNLDIKFAKEKQT